MTERTVLFNNCCGRDHVDVYDCETAFFDLNTTGRQSNQATDLAAGQKCVVLQEPRASGELRFDTYKLVEERIMTDKYSGQDARVFCGEHIGSDTLARSEALAHETYSAFFDVIERVKQTSAIIVE